MKLSPISHYYSNPPNRGGLIFGYTAFNEKEIRSGIEETAKIIESIPV